MGYSPFRKKGLTYHNPNKSIKGFTLFAQAYARDIYLLNMQGAVVKRWHFPDFYPAEARLLANGRLITSGTTADKRQAANQLEKGDFSDRDLYLLRLGGSYNSLREYSWQGELLWQYDNPHTHHEFRICENGDLIMPTWVFLPTDFAERVQGGYPQEEPYPPMVGDEIIRVTRTGTEVNRWRLWQMFDPEADPIWPLFGRDRWTHTNSIDIFANGNFLISCRHNSRVAVVDTQANGIVWKLADPKIACQQHDARILANGNYQIYDNGAQRPLSLAYSRIVEIDPETKEIVWQYSPAAPEQFFSGHLSNAQRLQMGNVFICEGTSGRLFEVTRAGEIVWEWINPFVAGQENGRQYCWIYRANRVPLDHPALAERALDPARYRHLNQANGLA